MDLKTFQKNIIEFLYKWNIKLWGSSGISVQTVDFFYYQPCVRWVSLLMFLKGMSYYRDLFDFCANKLYTEGFVNMLVSSYSEVLFAVM